MKRRYSLTAFLMLASALLAGCATTESTEADIQRTVQTQGVGTIAAADGVPIVYEVHGQGEIAVVFIHCWACNRAFWLDQIQPLTQAGYQVITFDLPGHGESGAIRENWSIAGLGNDVTALIADFGLSQVLLVGHDTGARMALDVAAQLPDRVIGIGCVDSLRNAEFEWPESVFEVIAEYMRENFEEGVTSVVSSSMYPGTHPRLADWILEQAMSSDQLALVELLADFATPQLAKQLEAVSVPVRCINAVPSGNRSLPTEIEINRKYADFDTVLLHGVGHYMQLERPEIFNPVLLMTLDELVEEARKAGRLP